MRRDKENLGQKQRRLEERTAAVRENHGEVVREMREFTQQKNDKLLGEAQEITEDLQKKHRELELIVSVR